MRLRRDPQALVKLAATPYLIKDLPFSTESALCVEIGMGKGEMLTQLAQQHPSISYLGIDREASVVLKAVRRAMPLELSNFKVLVGDAKLLGSFLAKPIDLLWLTFPDPWPKVRHAKRRLTDRHFLKIYQKYLAPNASLYFKTDNDALFAWSIAELKAAKYRIIEQTTDLASSEYSANNIATGYELKWMAKGKNINYLRALAPLSQAVKK